MCGIAGMMTVAPDGPGRSRLRRMAGVMVHRGPDGEGEWSQGNTGMIQRRLAIIDLATGDQPFREPGGAALVANAEIYNYVELRSGAEGDVADAPFATKSDCEPALFLYRRHGPGFADYLRGMYAIAIHDPAEGRLVLARDPFGIKPLYYAETPEGFIFASEIQALVAGLGSSPGLSPDSRDELLQLQFTTGPETVRAGICRVQPGETLVVSGGRVVERLRQAALPDGPPVALDPEAALGQLDAALEDSVRVHQRADVPYGMFLSGGVDSSALLALMARLNDRPIRAWTIGFPGTAARDEREHARRVARAVGAEHVEVEFDEADFWTLLPRVAEAMDDPAADYATLPVWKLAREASRDLRVILTGEGGDEMFAGYGRYRSVDRPWWMGGRVMRARGILDGLGILRSNSQTWRDGVRGVEAGAALGGRTRIQAAQAADCADWLPNDLLTKLDRCLMAHGVEGRTPFLDPVVARLALRLPDHLKIHKGTGKWILRRWLDGVLPDADAFSRKRGFTVPVAGWIAGEGARLGPLVAGQPGVREIADPDAVAGLFGQRGKREGFAAWTLLFYALWHQRHIVGIEPQEDAFATLAAR